MSCTTQKQKTPDNYQILKDLSKQRNLRYAKVNLQS